MLSKDQVPFNFPADINEYTDTDELNLFEAEET